MSVKYIPPSKNVGESVHDINDNFETLDKQNTAIAQSVAGKADTTDVQNLAEQLNNKANTSDLDSKADKTSLASKVDNDQTGATELIDALGESNATPGTEDSFIVKSLNQYTRRPFTTLLNWIKSNLAKVATSGSYNDLSNKPTIPKAVTVDAELSGTSTNPPQNKTVKAKFDAVDSQISSLGIDNNNQWKKINSKADAGHNHDSAYAAKNHTHSVATASAAGYMSAADKSKLDGIATGANKYSLPTASSSTLGGVKTTSTVTSTSGLTACPIISGVPYYKDTNTVYTHPTTSGNKHIPSGGSSGQILRWSADGTAVWGADNNTTYSDFVKSGSTAAHGLVPKPPTTAGTTKYLREDGTWVVPPNNTYSSLKNPYAITIQGNGTTLTNGTYDGSAAKTVNITPANIGAASSSHSHNYAGSSSAGGAATSANKLNTNAGSAFVPVYFKNGIPQACSYGFSRSGAQLYSGTATTATITNLFTAFNLIQADITYTYTNRTYWATCLVPLTAINAGVA